MWMGGQNTHREFARIFCLWCARKSQSIVELENEWSYNNSYSFVIDFQQLGEKGLTIEEVLSFQSQFYSSITYAQNIFSVMLERIQ